MATGPRKVVFEKAYRTKVLHLYRRALRIAHNFPHVPKHLQRKFIYNVKDAFHSFRYISDWNEANIVFVKGEKAVDGFEHLSTLDKETLLAFQRKNTERDHELTKPKTK